MKEFFAEPERIDPQLIHKWREFKKAKQDAQEMRQINPAQDLTLDETIVDPERSRLYKGLISEEEVVDESLEGGALIKKSDRVWIFYALGAGLFFSLTNVAI
jgi:hypothetical protein